MVVEYTISKATAEDAAEMAPSMRQIDVTELADGWGLSPLRALSGSLEASSRAFTARANGQIVCMYGVGRSSLISPGGVIWMLGTELVNTHARQFLRRSASQMARLGEGFAFLENYCDNRNTLTIRWLRWLGFTISKPQPYGLYGKPFCHFWKAV